MSAVRSDILSEGTMPDVLSKSYLGEFSTGDCLDPYEHLPTPMLTLETNVVAENIEAMASWASKRGVVLAPHGKTTMTPTLWKAQMSAGAVGITVANYAQARVALQAGVPLVVIANEFLSPPGLRWLSAVLAESPTNVMCWVDSVEAVDLMQRKLQGSPRPVMVCVELGVERGRAGARDEQTVLDIVAAIRRSSALSLSGFSGFEGAVPDHSPDHLTPVEEFLDRLGQSFTRHFDDMEVDTPILTAGGSAYFDVVVDRLKPVVDQLAEARLMLRSGAYLLHDDLYYGINTPHRLRASGPVLHPAATLWGRVISIPEPGLALVDVGKRDVAYDITLPQPLRVHSADGTTRDLSSARLINTNDQHGYLETVTQAVTLGDLIEFGQAHPCTIADKWREVPLITRSADGKLQLDGVVSTHF